MYIILLYVHRISLIKFNIGIPILQEDNRNELEFYLRNHLRSPRNSSNNNNNNNVIIRVPIRQHVVSMLIVLTPFKSLITIALKAIVVSPLKWRIQVPWISQELPVSLEKSVVRPSSLPPDHVTPRPLQGSVCIWVLI